MEKFYVYVIYSPSEDCYYRGFTENPLRRLIEHNQGESRFTSKCSDWKLVHLECYPTKREALIREKSLKKYSKVQLRSLQESSRNWLNQMHG